MEKLIYNIDDLEREWMTGMDGNPLSIDEPRSRLFTTLKPKPTEDQLMLIACRDGDLESCKRLYAENPACLTQQDANGLTPLSTAICRARFEVADFLLTIADPSTLVIQDNNGNRALHYAVYCRSLPLVRKMVDERGCDVKDLSTAKTTNRAIHLAMMTGSVAISQFLLERGATLGDAVECGPSPAWSSVVQDRLDCFQMCAANNPKLLEQVDSDDMPLFWSAIMWGATKIVRWLVESGFNDGYATLDRKYGDNGNVATIAAKHGCVELLNYLLSQGVNLNVSITSTGESTLAIAASQGFLETVQFLESKGSVPLYSVDLYGSTPLTLSALGGHIKVSEYIASKRGFDKLTQDGDAENTCISHAITNDQREYLDWLFDKMDVDIHHMNVNGVTALYLAAEHGRLEILENLLRRGARPDVRITNPRFYPTPFLVATVSGHVPCMQKLYEAKREVLFDLTQYRRNAFISALLTGNIASAKWLLENDTKEISSFAEVDEGRLAMKPFILDNTGKKTTNPQLILALFELVNTKQDDSIKLLHEIGVDMEIANSEGSTPLFLSIWVGTASLARYLIQTAKVSLFREDPRKANAVHLAANRGDMEILKLVCESILLEKPDYDFDVIDSSTWTPLSFAVAGGFAEAIEYLLDVCKVPLESAKSEVNMMELAAHSGKVDVVKLVVQRGAKMPPNEKGKPSPVLIAIRDGNLDVVKYFVDTYKFDLLTPPVVCHSWMREAITKGESLPLVSWLYYHGVSLYNVDSLNSNLVHAASHLGHVNFVAWAHKHGVPLNAKNNEGTSPVQLAAHFGQLSAVKYLVMHGVAPVQTLPESILAPIELARRKGNTEVVNFLTELGFS